MNTENVMNFIGRDLSSFKIKEMTEVYNTDYDGRPTTSVGFFEDPEIAKAFSERLKDNFHGTRNALVLTDGNVGFIVDVKEVNLFDDEVEALRIREEIISELSSAERKIMGL